MGKGKSPGRVQRVYIKLHPSQSAHSDEQFGLAIAHRSIRVMACFIPKNPGQQVGAGHVDVAVWLVIHCVCGDIGGCKVVWGISISGDRTS